MKEGTTCETRSSENYDIKADLSEIVCVYMEWIQLAQESDNFYGFLNDAMNNSNYTT
jgi:hypothetical protein